METETTPFDITDLRVEHCPNPMGVETCRPRLSWRMTSAQRGKRQIAFRVRAATSPALLEATATADLWDSGRVESDASVLVPYEGRALKSRDRCWWQVHVFDAGGHEQTSDLAFWEMGLLEESDWKAQWITGDTEARHRKQAVSPLLRRVFRVQGPVADARAYVCGLGYYEFHLNGRKVSDAVLHPAFTHYDKRALYTVHDITGLLAEGDNAAGIMLGTGWYDHHGKDGWGYVQAPWRDECKALVQIEIRYADGTATQMVSDADWHAATGPVLFDGLRHGEIYDAREEKRDWADAGGDPRAWQAVRIARPPGGVLRAQLMPPCRVIETLRPVSVRQLRPGVYIVDAGRNVVGWARLRVNGPAGTEVVMRYAELLGADGDIHTENIAWVDKEIFQTDTYILRGEGEETWEPRFTYHGFQYIQLSGLPQPPGPDTVKICIVSTDLPLEGYFSSSDDLLNRIHGICLASTRGNFHGFPTDCPHREKLGWTADGHLAAEQILHNFDAAAAYGKWLDDFTDCQRASGAFPAVVPTCGFGYNWGSGPAWDSAYILIAWYLYLYRGDTEILRRHFPGMLAYLRFLAGMATGHIIHHGLGDWSPPTGAVGDANRCPASFTNTAYYHSDVRIVARIAGLIGETAEAARLDALADRIRHAFRAHYIDAETGHLRNRTQTAIACFLYHGLAEAHEKPALGAMLLREIEAHDGHLDCGILGTKALMNTLTDLGFAETALKIATRRTFPGWGHWIERGATTIWESWGGGGSQNHVMYSDIGAWFYKTLAGIRLDPEHPGFRHVVIKPWPVGNLQQVDGAILTPYGRLHSAWHRTETRFEMEVCIPANCTATVWLPACGTGEWEEGGRPLVESEGVAVCGIEEGRTLLNVVSGCYHFTRQP